MTTAPAPAATAGLSRDLRGLAGTVSAPRTRVVTAEDVRRFRQAVGSGDGPAAPATFFCPDPLVVAAELGLPRPRPLTRTIDGGSEWEITAPVRVGDSLTLIARIAGITARTTADGRPMVLTVIEVSAWNQHGHPVGTARGTSVSYEERS